MFCTFRSLIDLSVKVEVCHYHVNRIFHPFFHSILADRFLFHHALLMNVQNVSIKLFRSKKIRKCVNQNNQWSDNRVIGLTMFFTFLLCITSSFFRCIFFLLICKWNLQFGWKCSRKLKPNDDCINKMIFTITWDEYSNNNK